MVADALDVPIIRQTVDTAGERLGALPDALGATISAAGSFGAGVVQGFNDSGLYGATSAVVSGVNDTANSIFGNLLQGFDLSGFKGVSMATASASAPAVGGDELAADIGNYAAPAMNFAQAKQSGWSMGHVA